MNLFPPIVLIGLLLGSIGCKRTYGQQACRIENEVVLASTGRVPSAVAIRAVGQTHFWAAWSADNATFIQNLESSGNPIGEATRIERTLRRFKPFFKEPKPKTFWSEDERASFAAEHLDLLTLGDGKILVIMLERPRSGRGGGAYAWLASENTLRDSTLLRLGPAFAYASGIAVTRFGNGVVVAWHEGRLSTSEIRLVRLKTDPLRIVAETQIKGDHARSGPALATVSDRVLLAWYETVLGGQLSPKSQVIVARLTDDLEIKNKRTVATCRFLEPAPDLAEIDGNIGIVFRDDLDKDETPEFYYSLLDINGVTIQPKKRISQADGLLGPSLVHTPPFLMSATIRSFQRNLLVGVNRFDLGGVKQGGEFQVYADKTDFVRVDLAANKKSLLMIYAEDQRKRGRVLASQVICLANH